MLNPAAVDSIALPSRRELQLVFGGLMLALALAALDQNIVAPALPRIVSDLGGLAYLPWVVSAFMLTATITTPLYGKLSDMYGRKALLIVAISIFLVGSAFCGLARTMTQLILFRGLQGLGAGGLVTLAQTTMADMVSPRDRGKYQGLFVAVFAVCSVAGPLLGGYLTDALSWRWIFYVNLPVGAVAFLMIIVGFHRPHHVVNHRIDYAGAVLLTSGTASLLLALTLGGSVFSWASPLILALFLSVPLYYGLLVVCEFWAAEPILPPRLFVNPVFLSGTAGMGLSAMAMVAATLFLPVYFQLVIGVSPTQSGLLISPLMGGLIVASVVGGRLISATGRYKVYPLIGLTIAISAYGVMGWVAATGGWVFMVVALVALGLGFGLIMPTLTVAVQNAVDRSDLGVATSAAAFIRSLGMLLGASLAGAIVTFQLHRLLPDAALHVGGGEHGPLDHGLQHIAQLPPVERQAFIAAYQQAISTTFQVGAGLAVFAVLAVLLLPERTLKAAHSPIPAGAAGPEKDEPAPEPTSGAFRSGEGHFGIQE
jgi:EmrB/QacA subfamily drug resistance transporter